MGSPALHPALAPLAFLHGNWQGEGAGEYPTIKPFRYQEEVTFAHNGKPFFIYTQRTRALDDGRPLHTETGYLRAVGESRIELVIAQPIGFAEISVGRIHGTRLELEVADVIRSPTAKTVTAVERRIWLENETLRYELAMGMSGGGLIGHLAATLHRVS